MAEIYSVKTFDQIYDAMKRWLIGKSSTLNNFNEGSRLSVLLEAIAMVMAMTNEDYYNGLKNAIPVAIYNGFGFQRRAGTKANGYLIFSRSAPALEDIPIPLGTAVIYNGIQYATTDYNLIPTGQTESVAIPAQAQTVGIIGNIGSGTIDTSNGNGSFANQPVDVEAVINSASFVGGVDEETDESRRERFQAYASSFSRSTLQGLISGALSVDGIRSASVIEFMPTLGWVTLFVDDGTGTISQALLDEVTKVINGDINDPENYSGYRPVGVQVQIRPPNVIYVDLTINIKILNLSLADDNEVKQACQNSVETYINALQLGNDVILSEITTAMQNSNVDVYDVNLSFPTSNITVPSDSVARTRTITITSTRVDP